MKKKFLATALVAAMTLSSSVVAFAAPSPSANPSPSSNPSTDTNQPEITDTKSNVDAKVAGTTDTLVQTTVSKADQAVIAKQKLGNYVAVDLTLVGGDYKQGNKVTITLNVASIGLKLGNNNAVNVYRVKDGKFEKVTTVAVAADGSFAFTTDHFTAYVFEATTKTEPGKSDKKATDTKATDAKADDTKVEDAKADTSNAAPQTGDATPVAALAFAAAGALAVAGLSKKRKDA